MSPSKPFSIFNDKKMKKKKKTTGDRNGPDELALVKAAAWAWYQRGSGSEGKALSEFDATKSRWAPRPSRYKLEAVRLLMDEESSRALEPKPPEGISPLSETPSPVHSTTTSSSLLDTHEILSISKQLDYFIESTSMEFGEKLCVKDVLERQESWSSTSSRSSTTSTSSSSTKRSNYKKLIIKGFWVRPGLVCGSRDDVDAGALVGGRRRCPGAHVPVVDMVTCRPRYAHA